MRLQFLPAGVIMALISLLRTDAYAQMRDQSPTDWRTFEVPEFGTRIQVPAGIFAPVGKPERGSGQRFERSDGRAAIRERTQQLTCGIICVWTALPWTMCG